VSGGGGGGGGDGNANDGSAVDNTDEAKVVLAIQLRRDMAQFSIVVVTGTIGARA